MSIRCAHEHGLLRDSCSGCHAEEEMPHPADLVKVTPSWSDRVHVRCRRCAQTGSHPIHKKGRANV